MSLRTPLARARGLGSARHGTGHWWAQRLTALALVPLAVWFAAAIVAHAGADHATMTAWVGEPVTAVLLVLLAAATFHHAQLGIQVVIEDYVHVGWIRLASLIALRGAAVALGLAVVFAVLKIALGGG